MATVKNSEVDTPRSLLIVGGSDTGKTHYAGQLVGRLDRQSGRIKIRGMAESYAAFEDVYNRLSQGLRASHTPTTHYGASELPLLFDGQPLDLVWPDYGGEQIRHIVEYRRWSKDWQERIAAAEGWIFFVRLDQLRKFHDMLSRPPSEIRSTSQRNETTGESSSPSSTEHSGDAQVASAEVQKPSGANLDFDWSGQAFLVELLQILLFACRAATFNRLEEPRLTIVISCWDELHIADESVAPLDLLQQRAPLLASFVAANWKPNSRCVLGLSSTEKPLSDDEPDEEYQNKGPEHFGYVVLPDGSHTKDLTLPVVAALGGELSG